ncbi:MAG: glucose-6-phosphate isomerase [Rhodobacteraceae bacterium]|nr:MAG: glucose-6-phosphate isomerase [Paracoccaceae bacterium]
MVSKRNKLWKTLKIDWARLKQVHLRDLFQANQYRFDDFSVRLDDLLIDFSKERLDEQALENLLSLARASNVEAARDAMFAGEAINTTEDRAVMHIALRANRADGYQVDGAPTADLVEPVLDAFLGFADAVRSGVYKNTAGQAFTDVVNIGIGGSDLGPVMATRALSRFSKGGLNAHFVSNVDGAHLRDVIRGLDPATTLILVASKSFTTQETMINATAAKAWVQDAIGAKAARPNFAALSTNLEATAEFGIPQDRVFGFWDWVGGRYSLPSSIGLSLALSIGSNKFRDFLSGYRAMDQHFKTAPLAKNLPVLMALIGIWRRNIMECETVALIPYNQRLENFAAYVQQLDMESNGKSVTKSGQPVDWKTGPVIWGDSGTNAQHSFFQLIHQGTDIIPIDFMITAKPASVLVDQHDLLTANFLAQSHALAFGKTAQEVRADMQAQSMDPDTIEMLVPHRTFSGNRPSTSIVYESLTPFALGRLIALYEHKIFVQGVIWDVNSFDQWGVELGKVMASQLATKLEQDADLSDLNSSTRGLIETINALKKTN